MNSLRTKIFRYMVINTILFTLIFTVIISSLFYINLSNDIKSDLEYSANFYAQILEEDSEIVKRDDERITVIESDGTVIYDSDVDINTMGNHSNRPEIIDAFDKGFGESKRYSDTISEETYYYATRVDQDTVVRVSITTSTIFSIFINNIEFLIIALIVMLIVTFTLSFYLSKRIVLPINIENDQFYKELSPYVDAINKQKRKVKKQVKELHSREITMQTIMDNMEEGLIVLDKYDNVISVNQGIKSIFNVGENTEIDDLSIVRNEKIIEMINSNDNYTFNVEIKSVLYQVVISSVMNEDKYIGKIVLFIDITELELNEKLRKEFSANVSHELKTPLATILGFTELIENNLVDANKQQEFILKIKRETKRLITLVEEILLISHLDESVVKKFEQENIKSVIESVITTLEPIIVEKNIVVELESPIIQHQVNYRLFYELIYNLIQNAVDYNHEDGTIKIIVNKNNNKLIIEVIDNGIGIASSEQERIFERFYRVEKSRSKKTGGTGLGLSIVKHAVKYHGGVIEVESELGKGTKFKIVL